MLARYTRRTWLIGRGPNHKRLRLLEQRAEALREAYDEGVVLRVIAETLGVTRERTRQLFKDARG